MSSQDATSATVSPARASAAGMASTGPSPITSGATPLTEKATKRASGLTPARFRKASETTSTAAAPSVICEELPAVTLPSTLKAGRSAPSPAAVVSRRTPSSARTTSARFTSVPSFRATDSTSTGTSSASNRPASCAAAARRWLSAAKASWSARPTWCRSATSSAVMPMEA